MSSERMPDQSELMMDVLAPIVMEAYTIPAQQQAESYRNSYRRGQTSAEKTMYSLIDSYDFAASGIEPIETRDIEGGSYVTSPANRAKSIIMQAFADAEEVVGFAQSALHDSNIDPSMRRSILARSGGLVVLLASIPESSVGELFTMAHSHTNDVDEFPEGTLRTVMQSNPVVVEKAEDEITLDWHPSVKDWMLARVSPDRGCPARGHQVTALDGQKMTLMKLFWTKLVDSTPSQPVSAGSPLEEK